MNYKQLSKDIVLALLATVILSTLMYFNIVEKTEIQNIFLFAFAVNVLFTIYSK